MKKYFVRATVIFLSPAAGGRAVMPVGDGFAPYIRSKALRSDLPIRIYGLPSSGVFNETYNVELELTYHPAPSYIDLIEGMRFELVEGPKVIGSGRIGSGILEGG